MAYTDNNKSNWCLFRNDIHRNLDIYSYQVKKPLTDDEYRELQQALVDRPGAGALMVGNGGLRKIRWAKEGRGKRGGVRVIYYWAVSSEQILMLFMYPKGEQDDLTSAQKRC